MKISIDDGLTAADVINLRELNGWDHDKAEWQKCLVQNLINVSARDENGGVIGVGFLCGNQRHAELVDLVVHPDYRKHGMGREICDLIVNYALNNHIKYFGLTYDKNNPWLKDFYESEGFRQIDFAMWHKSSLKTS